MTGGGVAKSGRGMVRVLSHAGLSLSGYLDRSRQGDGILLIRAMAAMAAAHCMSNYMDFKTDLKLVVGSRKAIHPVLC